MEKASRALARLYAAAFRLPWARPLAPALAPIPVRPRDLRPKAKRAR